MKKKIAVLISILVIIIGGFFIDNYQRKEKQSNLEKKEMEEDYQQAVSDYENGNYDSAYYLLADIPKGYENRDAMYEKLSQYDDQYDSALSLIKNSDYDESMEKLNKLPDGYRDKDLIINNMGKIKKLVENKWYDSPKEYDWYYETTFSFSTYSDDLTLYIYEDEYSGTTFMNAYTDSIDLMDLLDDGKAYVESGERDSFDLDINAVESGEYTTSTSYVTSTYKIKESIDPVYVRPDCIVDGCPYKAVTSMVGISGQMEYYCSDHYEQLGEMMSDMMGLD